MLINVTDKTTKGADQFTLFDTSEGVRYVLFVGPNRVSTQLQTFHGFTWFFEGQAALDFWLQLGLHPDLNEPSNSTDNNRSEWFIKSYTQAYSAFHRGVAEGE